MIRKSAKFSISQQVTHEFYVVLRSELNSGKPPHELRAIILTLMNERIKELGKTASIFLVLAIIVATLSSNSLVTIKTSLVQLDVPEIYLVFVAAACWAGIVVSIIKIMILLVVRLNFDAMKRVGERFSSARMAIEGGDSFDALSGFRPGHYYKLTKPLPFFVNAVLFVIFASFLLPLFGAYFSVLADSWSGLWSGQDIFLSSPLALASLILLIFPFILSVLIIIPVGISKDLMRIRWLFLVNVTGNGTVHPQAAKWLESSKQPSQS